MAEAPLHPSRRRLIPRVLIAMLAGAVVAGVPGFALALMIGASFGVSRDGADKAMILVFTMGPLAVLTGALIGAMLAFRSRRGES